MDEVEVRLLVVHDRRNRVAGAIAVFSPDDDSAPPLPRLQAPLASQTAGISRARRSAQARHQQRRRAGARHLVVEAGVADRETPSVRPSCQAIVSFIPIEQPARSSDSRPHIRQLCEFCAAPRLRDGL